MNIKEFIEQAYATHPINALETVRRLIELESIERYLNVMYGVELDIKIVPAEKKEGRFYGKGIIEGLK